MLGLGDPMATVVTPDPLEHDPVALADAEAAAKADTAAWEQAAAALDAVESRFRRVSPADPPAELRAAQLAEEGARRRADRSRRAYEERRVAWIVAGAAEELPALAGRAHAAHQAAVAALEALAAAVDELHRTRARIVADLRATSDDLDTRLRLTGLVGRWLALPQPGPSPLDRIAAAAEAARRAWTAR